MITARQEAIRILHRFIQINDNSFYAKECALILVSEIKGALLTYEHRHNIYELQNMENDFRYWDLVEREIHKL